MRVKIERSEEGGCQKKTETRREGNGRNAPIRAKRTWENKNQRKGPCVKVHLMEF
jgi:hypothetical protein